MFCVIVAIIAWGIWAVAERLALRESNPHAALLVNNLVYVVSVPFIWGLMRSKDDAMPAGGHWWVWAVLAGVLGIIANLCFMSALQVRSTTSVVSWTQLYPLVTYALCFMFLGEKLTSQKLAGAALMLVGAFIMNR